LDGANTGALGKSEIGRGADGDHVLWSYADLVLSLDPTRDATLVGDGRFSFPDGGKVAVEQMLGDARGRQLAAAMPNLRHLRRVRVLRGTKGYELLVKTQLGGDEGDARPPPDAHVVRRTANGELSIHAVGVVARRFVGRDIRRQCSLTATGKRRPSGRTRSSSRSIVGDRRGQPNRRPAVYEGEWRSAHIQAAFGRGNRLGPLSERRWPRGQNPIPAVLGRSRCVVSVIVRVVEAFSPLWSILTS
jgi:hypothetical protein